MKMRHVFRAIVLGAILILSFQNCSKTGLQVEDLASVTPQGVNTSTSPTPEPSIVPLGPISYQIQPASDYICSPFGGTVTAGSQAGLKAELRYLSKGSSSMNAVDYFDDSRKDVARVASAVYLSDVNVPTRKFNEGFASSANSLVQDNNGNTLIEYFGLKMETVLKLSDSDAEGIYDLATVSDDGTVVQIQNSSGQWVNVIDNDGQHAPRMGCGSTVVGTAANPTSRLLMTRASRVPVRIYYNQGPRELIANVLFWNYRGAQGSSPAISDSQIRSYCDHIGATEFFNPYILETLGPWVKDMKDNLKWKIVAAGNFLLPKDEVNPCAFANLNIIQSLTYSESSSGLILDLKLTDAALGEAKLYKVSSSGVKSLVKSLTLANTQLEHSIALPVLDPSSKYKIEFTLTVPSKSVNVLKEYEISIK